MAQKYKTNPKCYQNKQEWEDEQLCNYTQDDLVLLFANDDAKDVVVHEDTEVICDEAFRMTDVETIHLSNVKAVGDRAFEGCERLHKVIVNGETPYFGKDAFKDCPSLRFIEFPTMPKEYGARAFGSVFVCTTEQKAFLDNVWFFIDKGAPYIWKYPEVAMAKIPFESGTSFSGGFCPLLGAMVRWWMWSDLGNVLTMDGEERGYALYRIGGGLSGAGIGDAIDRLGNHKRMNLNGYKSYLGELCAIQREFKEKYPDVKPMEFSEALKFLKEKTSHKHEEVEYD